MIILLDLLEISLNVTNIVGEINTSMAAPRKSDKRISQ